MVHRAVLDLRRRRRPTVALDEAFLIATEGRAVEGQRLNQALAALPDSQRTVVYLRHWLELSFKEIGVVTGVPTFTAASRYRLALRRLRGILGVQP